MNRKLFVPSVLTVAVVASFAIAPDAIAGGFQIRENSAAALGRAFAGRASAPGDAAIVSNNPAGMRLLGERPIFQADATLINLSAEYDSNNGTHNFTRQPLTGGDGGDAGDLLPVASAFFATPIGEKAHLGFFIDAPFGLKTEYDNGWVGRYSALKSDLRVIDLGASFSYDVNPYVSFGVSVYGQRLDAELSQAVDYGLFLGQSQQRDGKATIEGDATDWGFKLGVLLSVTENTHIGLSYQSKVKQDIDGKGTFRPPQARNATEQAILDNLPPLLKSSKGSTRLDTPAVAILSVFHKFNDRWAVTGDISRTAWTSFQELVLDFDTTPGERNVVETYGFRDTTAVSIGVEYQLNERWLLRGGIGYDQTPTSLEHRNARLPDADRRLLGLGFEWKPSDRMVVDVGYLHLFNGEPEITTTSNFGRINGSYSANIDLLSASLGYVF